MERFYCPDAVNCGDVVEVKPADQIPPSLSDMAGMRGVVSMMIYYTDELLYLEEVPREPHGRKTHARVSHVEKVACKVRLTGTEEVDAP